MLHALFICGKGRLRSPTAEQLSSPPGPTSKPPAISAFGVQQGFTTHRNAQINDSRQIVASIAFTDGSEAVVRFQLPLPPCPADFNRQNGLEVQDIFAFLQAWFAGEPRADFDSGGTLEVVDIFAFLQAWFAGCA